MKLLAVVGDAMLLCWAFGTLMSQMFPKAMDEFIRVLGYKPKP